jgi:hypothetical protein
LSDIGQEAKEVAMEIQRRNSVILARRDKGSKNLRAAISRSVEPDSERMVSRREVYSHNAFPFRLEGRLASQTPHGVSSAAADSSVGYDKALHLQLPNNVLTVLFTIEHHMEAAAIADLLHFISNVAKLHPHTVQLGLQGNSRALDRLVALDIIHFRFLFVFQVNRKKRSEENGKNFLTG